jgi:protein-tyrosine phosphatase
MSLQRVLLFAPHLGLIHGVWHAKRLVSRERPFDRIGDGLIVSRRLLDGEVPSGVTAVVDLAAEFPETPALRSKGYRSLPVMDGDIPAAGELEILLAGLPGDGGVVLIHCAEGHGRSATVAACLLLRRGMAGNAEEAMAIVTAARPLARLLPPQRAFVERFARSLPAPAPAAH